MFQTFKEAHSAAVAQNLIHGCAVHIQAVITKMPAPDETGVEHYVSGYRLSHWCDGTTVHSVIK